MHVVHVSLPYKNVLRIQALYILTFLVKESYEFSLDGQRLWLLFNTSAHFCIKAKDI